MAPMDMRPKIDPNRPLDLRIATEVLGQKPPWDFDHSGELEWTKEEFPDPQNPALVRIRRWPPYYSRDPLQALLLVEQLQALYGLDGPPSGPRNPKHAPIRSPPAIASRRSWVGRSRSRSSAARRRRRR